MIKYFLIGIVSALPFTISFGPVFFAITETSLKRGFISGAVVSLGIVVSDAIYITLLGLGFAAFFADDYSKSVFGLVGGIVLISLGISFLRKKLDLTTHSDIKISKKPVESFFKGFIINSLNPYVALFWTAMVAFVNTEFEIGGSYFVWFFIGFLLVLFLSDITKAWLAEILRKKLTSKINILYRIVAGIFLFFGSKLLIESIIYFWN